VTKIGDKNVLILGASGYIGPHLRDRLGPDNVVATYNSSPIVNGTHFDALSMRLPEILNTRTPISHAVILFGATNLNECAKNVEETQALNVDGIVRVIKDLIDAKIRVVFCSSDSVFDGISGNYSETDPPNPIVQYGIQKLEVERFIQDHCDDFCIIRPTRVYGTTLGDGSLFTSWISSLKNNELIKVATDQIMCPILMSDLTMGINKLLDLSATGIYHLAGPVVNSRAGFFDMLVEEIQAHLTEAPRVEYCRLSQFELPEIPPLNVSLNASKFIETTGFRPMEPRQAIQVMLANAGYGTSDGTCSP